MKRFHSDEGKVKCEICKKNFKHLQSLRFHQKIHESKRFECQFCDLKYLTEGQLNHHMKFHKNPEQFKCLICGHQTKRKEHLEMHLKTHNKNREKNFRCNQCDFKTNHKQSLKSHLKSHENLKEKLRKFSTAIKCEKCPSVLKSKRTYWRHFRERHKNIGKFQCDLCESKYGEKYTLKKHLAKKHFNL
jgi:KRAB domain-containing zinc finger protein